MIKKILKWSAIILVVLIGCFFIFAPAYVERKRNVVVEHTPYKISDKAKALHESLLIGDLHADSLLWKRNLLKRGNRGHVDIPRLIEGNVALQIFTVVSKSPSGQNYESNSGDTNDNITMLAIGQMWPPRTWTSLFERASYQSEKLHWFSEASAGKLVTIRTVSDLDDVIAKRKNDQKLIGAILGIEGAHVLEGDIKNLDGLFDAGYRVVGLHHFFNNALGGSLHGNVDLGLTEFGKQVVRALIAKNMIIDVAHSSKQVVRDVLAMSDEPLILSHTGIYSHCKVKRNIPDELMKAIAEKGGLIGIGYWADVTCDDSPAGVAKTLKAAIDLVGEDHVSLGSDFDGAVTTALDTSELAAITQALLDLGISEQQIRKVMGENLMRFLKAQLPK